MDFSFDSKKSFVFVELTSLYSYCIMASSISVAIEMLWVGRFQSDSTVSVLY